MDRDEVEARVRAALRVLLLRDAKLLELNVGERSIAAKLSAYMQPLFPTFDVDAEYNRHGISAKRLPGGHECKEGQQPLIVPDIVVHQRGGEIAGRCQHLIIAGGGEGVFEGVTGRFDMKDDVETGNFPYRGHFRS